MLRQRPPAGSLARGSRRGNRLTVLAVYQPPDKPGQGGIGGPSPTGGRGGEGPERDRHGNPIGPVEPWKLKAVPKGKTFKPETRRKGRPAHMRSPDDTPLRDGNRDRLIGLLTERAAKTLMTYLQETNLNLHSWMQAYMKANPIPRDGNWDEVSGETFLRQLLAMPIMEAKFSAGRGELFDNFSSMDVDPRHMALRIMEIRSVLAKEFIADLNNMAEENSLLMREVLQASLKQDGLPKLPGAETLEGGDAEKDKEAKAQQRKQNEGAAAQRPPENRPSSKTPKYRPPPPPPLFPDATPDSALAGSGATAELMRAWLAPSAQHPTVASPTDYTPPEQKLGPVAPAASGADSGPAPGMPSVPDTVSAFLAAAGKLGMLGPQAVEPKGPSPPSPEAGGEQPKAGLTPQPEAPMHPELAEAAQPATPAQPEAPAEAAPSPSASAPSASASAPEAQPAAPQPPSAQSDGKDDQPAPEASQQQQQPDILPPSSAPKPMPQQDA